MSAPLADFLYERGAAWLERLQPDVIVPVPSHTIKLKKRGFNPPLLLSRHLSKKSKIPVFHKALVSVKEVPSQAGLKRKDRLKNVRGAFLADKRQINERAVLLLDDVFTTGATADECARTLKKAGARQVAVMTLARAVDWDIQPRDQSMDP